MGAASAVRQSDLSSSSVPAPEAALARGTALGRFVVLGLVGRGAMGEVYGAYDPELDRKIAIKLVRAGAGSDGDTTESRTRLMREAQAAAKISHPNVVVVYDAGTFGERVFIAMEFVEGHTLRYWLQERGRSVPEVLDAFLAAGRGLAAAHEKALVHRDFKPDNVMVGVGGQVRVMDFGLARVAGGAAISADESVRPAAEPVAFGLANSAVDLEATPILGAPLARDPVVTPTATVAFRDKITVTGTLLGTPAYMSPEQFQGKPADARSDQFSFCVALYEALFGVRPFAGRTLDELAQNVVGGRLVDPPASRGIPARVRSALERGLRADSGERFATMDALLAELERGAGAGRGGFATQAAAKLAGVWEAPDGDHSESTPAKEAVRQAFLATGQAHAATSFASVGAALDRYTKRWTELYVEVCEATHVRGEQSAEILDLRMAFLIEGLDDLKALCRVFREATAEVVSNADKAASALANLERCRDLALVRNAVRPPEDFETRVAVEGQRAELAQVRALERVGRFAEGLEAVEPLVAEARRLDYGPLLAEALMTRGTLEFESSRPDRAFATLEEAFSVAEMARHDEVAVEAAIHVSAIAGYYQARYDVADVWARYAETLLRRMGSHELLWGWFYNDRAMIRSMQGRLGEAIADAKRAVDAKERAGGHAFDVAISIGNLATYLAHEGDFEGAVATNQKAIAILTEVGGADHVRVAFALGNQGQLLYRLGRIEEAAAAATRALAVLERQTDPGGLIVTGPLRTLGLCYLAEGRFDDALAALERAAANREAVDKAPLRLAEVHFPLARALYETGARERALALGRQARREYERAARTPLAERDLAELDEWLAARKPAPTRAFRRTSPGSRPRPRRASRGGRRPSSPK
jgi:tetratricopeptide (TPR) repeat protein